jgi:hypothetical protein
VEEHAKGISDALRVSEVRTMRPWVFRLSVAVGGSGFPLGSISSRRLAQRFAIGPSLIVAAVPSVLGLGIAASARGHYAVLVLAAGTFLNGAGQGVFAVNAITIRHLATPPSPRSVPTAVHRTATWGALPVVAAIAGGIGGAFGARVAMLMSAGMQRCVSSPC